MSVLKVAVLGNPVLRQKASPIKVAELGSKRVQELIRDMIETMLEYEGRGLAGPQVHESLQIVVMLWDFDKEKEAKVICLINPEIRPLTEETFSYWEGCLSLPGMRGKVSRPNKVSVKALNERGEKVDFIAEGFKATVIQHECDHLEGKLYIDKMLSLTELSFEREYRRFWADDPKDDAMAE